MGNQRANETETGARKKNRCDEQGICSNACRSDDEFSGVDRDMDEKRRRDRQILGKSQRH